eukprot:9158437-Prorocentrum_lima.AAC.1
MAAAMDLITHQTDPHHLYGVMADGLTLSMEFFTGPWGSLSPGWCQVHLLQYSSEDPRDQGYAH